MRSGDQGGSKVSVTLHFSTLGTPVTCCSTSAITSPATGVADGSEGHGHVHRRVLDRQAVDQAEIDDIDGDLGIVALAQGGEDGFDVDRRLADDRCLRCTLDTLYICHVFILSFILCATPLPRHSPVIGSRSILGSDGLPLIPANHTHS